jgi:hypothetical protein
MKKIGTDVSLEVCRSEGYMVAEYKISDLIKGDKLDKDCFVRLTRSNPLAWYGNGRVKIGTTLDIYNLDEWLSYNDVMEAYLSDRDSIDRYMGNVPSDHNDFTYCDYTTINPTIHDLLWLATCVDDYHGLRTC